MSAFLLNTDTVQNVNKMLKLYNNLKKTCKKFGGNNFRRTFVTSKQQSDNR